MKIYIPLIIIFGTLVLSSKPYKINRKKRSYAENFNVLLSLYRMNPLKHSNIFKTFSNRVLLPRPDERNHELHYNSNESTKNFKGAKETTPGTYYSPRGSVIDQAPHIKNTEPENFNPGHFLNTLISTNENRAENDETENLLNNINIGNEASETTNFNEKRKEHGLKDERKKFKVYNMNRIDYNKIDFDDADVVVVK